MDWKSTFFKVVWFVQNIKGIYEDVNLCTGSGTHKIYMISRLKNEKFVNIVG